MTQTATYQAISNGIDRLTTLLADWVGAPEGSLAELQRIGAACALLHRQRSDLPHVLLLGEFKAGKSSLVNALLGHHVAPTATLEMTPITIQYTPAAETYATLIYQNGDVTEQTDLDQLMHAIGERRFDADADLSYVVVGTPSRVPVVLIDTPGYGSSTREHEQRALASLEQGDMILLVIDGTNLGGLRDWALVRRAVDTGLQLQVVVTRGDLLVGETAEILDWFDAEMGLSSSQVSIVDCAPNVVLPADHRLRVSLDTLAANTETVRKRQRLACERQQLSELRVLAASLLSTLEREVESDDFLFDLHSGQLTTTLRVLKSELEDLIYTDFLRDLEQALVDKVKSAATAERDCLADLLSTAIPDGYSRAFAQRLDASISAKLGVDNVVSNLVTEGLVCANGRQPLGANVMATAFDVEAFQGGSAVAVSAAAMATAYGAWLAPGAASVSFGAALSGIGIPVAVLGLALSGVVALRQREKSANARSVVAVFCAEVRSSFVTGVLHQQVFPILEAAVSDQLAAPQTNGAVSVGGLSAGLRRECAAWLRAFLGRITTERKSSDRFELPLENSLCFSLPDDRYVLEELVAQGATAWVYRGYDTKLERAVAVKVLQRPGSDQAVKRIVDEARAMALVASPYVARVFDVLEELPAVVMEWLGNKTLRSVLQNGELSNDQVARLALDVTRGLVAIHSAGLVHRDLKPENIAVVGEGFQILDFGIAVSDAAQDGQQIAGTPQYMAPEQLVGKGIDARTDLFALAVVLEESGFLRAFPRARKLLASLRATDREQRPVSAKLVLAALSRLTEQAQGDVPNSVEGG